MALTEMKIRQWCRIVIYDDAVIFVDDDQYGRILVADLIEISQKLNDCIAPIRLVGRGSLRDVEQEPMSDLAAFVGLLPRFCHAHQIRTRMCDGQGVATCPWSGRLPTDHANTPERPPLLPQLHNRSPSPAFLLRGLVELRHVRMAGE